MKKKHFAAKALLGSALCATAAAITSSMYMLRKFAKKMEKNNKCNNYMHTVSMSSGHVELKADTDNAYMSCIMGGMTIELKEIPDHDINIDIYSLCGALTIKVPEGVNVEMASDNIGIVSQYNNIVPENNKAMPDDATDDEFADDEVVADAVQTIRIAGTTIFSSVKVVNI